MGRNGRGWWRCISASAGADNNAGYGDKATCNDNKAAYDNQDNDGDSAAGNDNDDDGGKAMAAAVDDERSTQQSAYHLSWRQQFTCSQVPCCWWEPNKAAILECCGQQPSPPWSFQHEEACSHFYLGGKVFGSWQFGQLSKPFDKHWDEAGKGFLEVHNEIVDVLSALLILKWLNGAEEGLVKGVKVWGVCRLPLEANVPPTCVHLCQTGIYLSAQPSRNRVGWHVI